MLGLAIALLVIGALIAYFANDDALRKVGIACCVVGIGIVLVLVLTDLSDEGRDLDAALPALLGAKLLRARPE